MPTAASSSANKVVVEITFGDTVTERSNTSEQAIKEAIVVVAGGDVDVEVVDVVFDEQGKLVSVVVHVDDETAQAIVAFVNDNNDRPASEECTAGVLCHATDVFIQVDSKPSAAASVHALLCITLAVSLLSHL